MYPKRPNPHDSLGEAYMHKGKKELAIKSYKQVLALEPDNNHAREMLKRLAKM